ncbi:hypothetical protein D1007_40906 [Hordeum vulgare]|nr:hypothetical protein D1007_40906 [Hordeum vulgare]
MGEKAVKKWVEKIGEDIVWGPQQEVSPLLFDDWKGEYVRIEDGEQIVEEIDRQNGWTSKQPNFFAQLIDLNIYLKVRYVPSHLAAQMVDDDWASQRPLIRMFTELTVVAEEGQVNGTETVAIVDWNGVELDEPDREMTKLFAFQSMTEIRRGVNLVCLLMLMKL